MKNLQLVVGLALATVLGVAPARGADTPKSIRVGLPALSYGKPFSQGAVGTAQVKGLFLDEFGKDGITVELNFLKGTGPAVNEALANNSLDIGVIGDLPAIAGRAGGLKTRLVAAATRGSNTYIVVPADSPIRAVAELKGKRVGVGKGTYMHAALVKILAAQGLTEKDLRLYNMDMATLNTAVATKDVDAAVLTSDAFTLRSRGVGRIIHSTKTDPTWFQGVGGVIVREQFAARYPELVRRFVKVFVQAAHLAATDRAEALRAWTRSGTPLATLNEDLEGETLEFVTSPLFDEHVLSHYARSVEYYKEIGLTRRTFDVEKDWIDRSFLDAALKELHLEKAWPEYDAAGKPKPAA